MNTYDSAAKDEPEMSRTIPTMRDLALRCDVYPARGNRFRVVTGSGKVVWATAVWKLGEPVVTCWNPVARLAVEIHERGRVARAQFGG